MNASEHLSDKRKQIVKRYDKGRDEGAVIDDWEDPDNEKYHKQDRFGFIHDQRLQEISGCSISEKRQLDKEMKRTDKWLKMLKECNKWFPIGARYHEKMVGRVWKGVPDSLRGTVWYILLDINRVKKGQKGKYEEMKKMGRKHSPDIRQIDLDVNRTYRDHIMFRARYNRRQQDLFHVLSAYSVYNTEVGYCQGMSQIAALLLMYLNSDEDAFWALSQLMVGPKYNMHGFFIPGFPTLMRFQAHHDKILKKKLNGLQKHLMVNHMETGIHTMQWFLQCFLDRIPFSLTIRVWDLYLLEGESIMIAMAYNILKLHSKSLMKMGMDELMDYFQKTLKKDFGYDDDFVIETALRESLEELRSSNLHTVGLPPDSEKPQKSFGVLENIQTEEEQSVVGKRLPVGAEETLFYKNTAQREEDNIKVLQQHIFQVSSDESANLCLNEMEELDISSSSKTLTPTSENGCSNHIPSDQAPSVDQLHLMYLKWHQHMEDETNDSLIFQMWQRSLKENHINSVSNDKGSRTRQCCPTKDGRDKGDNICSRTDSGNSSMPSSESIQAELHPEESSSYHSHQSSCDDNQSPKHDFLSKTSIPSTKPRYYFGESPDLENIVNHSNAEEDRYRL